ncbi:MAG: ABC transporter permease, partial [Cupriavidus sp.]|nr:ABC transporter permease [Cupriavidus sp.]
MSRAASPSRLGDRALGILGIVAFLLVWELVPRLHIVSDAYLSPPSQIIVTIWDLVSSGALFRHLFASLQRSLYGLLSAIVLGVVL